MLSNIFKRFNVVSAAGTALVGALVALALILAPQAALATAVTSKNLTTHHWKQGATHGYSITATVTVASGQAGLATMTISGGQLAAPVALEEKDTAGTTYSATFDVPARPAGETYTVDVTYFDADPPTAAETLNLTVGTVLDTFATPTSPLGGVGPTTNPTFTWSAPQSGSVSSYRLGIYGLNVDPWVSAQLAFSTLSAQYLPTAAETTAGYPASLVLGTLYGWSVYAYDINGNSAENRDGTVMVGANLSGTVTDFAGAAVSGATVYVYNGTVPQGPPATTGTDGSYLIGGLATSTTGYKVVFKKTIDGVQQTTNYNNRLDYSSALYANYDPLPVTSGTAGVLKTGINAVLGGWGAIAGKVVNSSSAGISGITVQLLDTNGNPTSYPNATTNSSGIFTFSLLPPATYKVKAIGSTSVYVDVTSAPLTVSAGQVTEPNNITLGRATIKGTVTDTSGAPIAGVWVYLLTTSGAYYPGFYGVQTGTDGNYAISAGIGNYKISFSPVGSTYAKQYYNRKATDTTADVITVASTTVPLTGVNAVLGSGKPTITDFTVPAASSSLTVSGITFTASEPAFGVAGYMITESATAPAAADAGWKTTAPASYTFAGVGEKTLYAWAKGATGLISDSIARGVTVTYTAPALTLSTLSDQATTAHQVLNVAGVAASGITSLTVNGQAANLATDGSFSFPVKLAAGANTVEVVATDSVSATSTVTRSITYDASAPALSVTQPADNQVTTTGDATVSGTVVAGATVAVSVNGGTPVQAIVSGTDWIANVTLAAGVNTIEVVAELSGKQNYVKRTLSLVSALPDLVVTAPVQDVIIDKSTQTITGTVSDGATVSISAGGTTYTPQVTSGSFSQEVSFSARGSYPVTVTATSAAGTSTSVRNLLVERRIGDCNNSGGAITSADLQYAINIVISKPGFNSSTFCDVNFDVVNGVLVPDGKTSSADVQTLINVLIMKTGWVLP